uniref:Mucin-4-like n=1 Tax=Saccoglossus kowalevskii TaxID=10224 RepID=A0ABM0MQX4_SACKO
MKKHSLTGSFLEINECASNPCDNGECIDEVNQYFCICLLGWTGTNCETDIDECFEETDECDDNANCQNAVGSYTCTCKDGYRGNGFNCYEIILFPFGTAIEDKKLRQTYDKAVTDSTADLYDLISPTIKPPVGFPFMGQFYYSLYFTDNGLIVFMNENDEKNAYAHPSGIFNSSHQIPMVAAFWEDVDMSDANIGEVYYQEYSYDSSNHNLFVDVNKRIYNIYGDNDSDGPGNFNATWILKVTWFEVADFSVKYSRNYPNTFQALLATDGIFGFVILNYKEQEMRWKYANKKEHNVVYGYNSGAGQIMNLHTGFNISERYRPDLQIGNTGLQGRWIIRLETNTKSTVNYKKRCLDWYNLQPPPETWNRGLSGCPCGFQQGENDNSFGRGNQPPPSNNGLSDDERNHGVSDEIQQGISRRRGWSFTLQTANSNPHGAGMQCAYRGEDHSLVEGYDGDVWRSSFQERWQYIFRGWGWWADFSPEMYWLWLDDDLLPRYYCCSMSNDPAFCEMYAEKRPAGKCEGYIPPSSGWMFGDPHLKTLDGVSYSFNGQGEYTLLEIEGNRFELQARTERARFNNGSETFATVFTGFAAQQNDSSKVEIRLSKLDSTEANQTQREIEIFINGKMLNISVLDEDFYSDDMVNVKLRLKEDSSDTTRIVAIFSSGLSFSVAKLSGILDIVVSTPTSFKGKTQGLLGTWNNNTNDDFTMRNGTVVVSSDGSITDRQQFECGQTWMVTNESSLFTYRVDESWELFNYPDFTPYFIDELIDEFEEKDKDFLNMTRIACENNIDCVYDTLATRAMEIGLNTKTNSDNFEDNASKLENYPPRVNGEDVLRVEVNKPTTIELTAEDPNGDSVKFKFLEEIGGAEIGEESGIITWTPVNTSQIVFQVEASDGNAVSAYKPVVQICDCKNNGTCLFDTSDISSNTVNSKFKVVACSCPEAYTGWFCETDTDGCLDDPCFPGVKCTDVEAPGIGAVCEGCPYGLSGDGKKCY